MLYMMKQLLKHYQGLIHPDEPEEPDNGEGEPSEPDEEIEEGL